MNRQRDEIDPDIIFLDSENLPNFDRHQFEGKIEKPISKWLLFFAISVILAVFSIYSGRLWYLQIAKGEEFKDRAENNRLDHDIVFAERGIIVDRNGESLAWNDNISTTSFAIRRYDKTAGLSHILGYLKYPAKDSSGFYYSTEYSPQAGIEKLFDSLLKGVNGVKLTEMNVHGDVITESILKPPVHGNTIKLSIDKKLQIALYDAISKTAQDVGFVGGAGVLMDINNGELLASVTYPEFSSDVMTNGKSEEIKAELNKKGNLFLDRISAGLYTPGSIVKPFVAIAALSEKIIDPSKQILSTGSIVIPNPYNPDKPSTFRDWKAHGLVDMRRAIAVSSDVYFYSIGGGYKDQKGLGITNLNKYWKMFGFGERMQSPLFDMTNGTIPNPDWKKEIFDGEEWRLGDTYVTSIGQYGMQVTPIQAVRAVSALANYGTLVEPTIILNDQENKKFWKNINIPPEYFSIVNEGMRQCVTDGTCVVINDKAFSPAAKSGTAEVGVNKEYVNSWLVGFFPYENPKYAFAVVMERGPAHNLVGAGSVTRKFLDIVKNTAKEYTIAE